MEKVEAVQDYIQKIVNNRDSISLPRIAKGFIIKAELRLASEIKGIGVFAAQFIPAHTKVGEHHFLYFDEQETKQCLAKLSSDEERRKWLDISFGYDGKIVFHDPRVDDGGMVNHSNRPTIALNYTDGCSYATRDVLEGEELTEDYNGYDDVPFQLELLEKYGDWLVENKMSTH